MRKLIVAVPAGRQVSCLLLVVSCLLLVVSCMTGCGKTQVSVSDLSNQGEIQGKVYDLSASNLSASKLVPVSGAKIYIGSSETISGADGSYAFSGVPAGEVAIMATAEGFIPQTMVLNRKTVNIYLSGGSSTYESGSSTVSGTIYGVPAGVTSVYGSASSLLKRSTDFSYDPSLYRYTLTKAPDDGETYLFAYYSSMEAGNYRSIYTYTKLNMTSASKEANLDFGTSTKSLTVKTTLPSGYNTPTLVVSLYDGFRAVQTLLIRTQTQEADFSVTSLPALQSGDSFGITVTAVNAVTTETTYKALASYDISGESTVNLDLTTVPSVIQSSPADGASLSSNPTFSWEAISDDRVIYIVSLAPEGSYSAVWSGWTKGTSVTLPETLNLNNGNYQWQVFALRFSNLDLADYATVSQSNLNWAVASAVKRFSYAK